jgi:hypothetical protein
MTANTLLDFENAILDLFEKNRITIQGIKTVLWTLEQETDESSISNTVIQRRRNMEPPVTVFNYLFM